MLVQCGRLLDAADTGRVPVGAREYQKAARTAKALLEKEPQGGVCFELCANSPALGHLAEQVLSERLASSGEWSWARQARQALRPFVRGSALS